MIMYRHYITALLLFRRKFQWLRQIKVRQRKHGSPQRKGGRSFPCNGAKQCLHSIIIKIISYLRNNHDLESESTRFSTRIAQNVRIRSKCRIHRNLPSRSYQVSPRGSFCLISITIRFLRNWCLLQKYWGEIFFFLVCLSRMISFSSYSRLSLFSLLSIQVGIICGSGLSGLSKNLEHSETFQYDTIPGFPKATVAGHTGELVFGIMDGVQCVCMRGRFHYYEGKKYFSEEKKILFIYI